MTNMPQQKERKLTLNYLCQQRKKNIYPYVIRHSDRERKDKGLPRTTIKWYKVEETQVFNDSRMFQPQDYVLYEEGSYTRVNYNGLKPAFRFGFIYRVSYSYEHKTSSEVDKVSLYSPDVVDPSAIPVSAIRHVCLATQRTRLNDLVEEKHRAVLVKLLQIRLGLSPYVSELDIGDLQRLYIIQHVLYESQQLDLSKGENIVQLFRGNQETGIHTIFRQLWDNDVLRLVNETSDMREA